MQTVEYLRDLFRYNDWANRRIIVAVKESKSERCRQILAHLLTTEEEYLARLFGKDSTGFDFWPDLPIEDCGETARTTADKYEKLMRRFDEEGLDLWTRYRTSKGAPQENDFRDMLTHVIIHSSIHRGNIMLKLREEGFEPPKIDYIIYLRETKYV
ncbi:MAG TPA: DinB family protein [Pyrinomonadaceae bacterium]|nr:DinB family protein [Pyrinomonadaceae bacterium]